jgi:Tol biopolymer transport system component
MRAPSRTPAAVDAPKAVEHQARRQAPWWLRRVGLVLFLSALAIAPVWYIWPHPHWTVQSSRNLMPSLESETSPRISPNGSMLAYVANGQRGHGRIYIRNFQGGTPQAISPPDEDASSPAWASDSTHLAYVVAGRKGVPCRIMITTFPGGIAFGAGKCRKVETTAIVWQPASPYLFIEDDMLPSFGALFRLNTETAQLEPVTTPPASKGDGGARVSPDGKFLAYLRGGSFRQTLRLRLLTSGEERELPCDPDTVSIDWTQDSRTLLTSTASQMGGEILAQPIDGGHAYRVYASATPPGEISTGPNGMLALEFDEGDTSLARAHATRLDEPDIIDPAAGSADWSAFAPDGTLAFVSNRSGRVALWIRKPGGQPIELRSGDAKDIERPVWSPDGSRIAFAEIWKGQITIHVITAQGENVVAFSVPSIGFGMPNWTPDGAHLMLFDRRILGVVRVDLHNPDRREPLNTGVWDSVNYRNGATYGTLWTKPGIWQLDGAPRLITQAYPTMRRQRMAFVGDDVLLPGPNDGHTLQIMAQPLKGGPARLAYYAPSAEPDTPFAVDPRTGDVIYIAAAAIESHIDLLTLARQ